MYIVHLPTDIPDTPSDFQIVDSSCNATTCTDLFKWPFRYGGSHDYCLLRDGHCKMVPQDKRFFSYQRPRQEDGRVSLVAENPCGQSKPSEPVYLNGKITFMHVSYWNNCLFG